MPTFTIRRDLPFLLGDDVHLKRILRDHRDLDALVWLLKRWCAPAPTEEGLYQLTHYDLQRLIGDLIPALRDADARGRAEAEARAALLSALEAASPVEARTR